jgi:hypothetical protein
MYAVVYYKTRVWATEKNIMYKSQVGRNDYDIKRVYDGMACAVRDGYRRDSITEK